MSDKAWKQFERRVAADFGSFRVPLSGGNSRITQADVIHDRLFIECKQRKKMSIWSLYEKTRELAKKEGKVPMLALSEKNRAGYLVVMHVNDIESVACCRDIVLPSGLIW